MDISHADGNENGIAIARAARSETVFYVRAGELRPIISADTPHQHFARRIAVQPSCARILVIMLGDITSPVCFR
jgi:hypothetical protein